ncbi:MAG: 4Fe-4S binding protein [Acetobacterium woodii]|nr:4Fe-4S binding protein [Acetobacterium woodii]
MKAQWNTNRRKEALKIPEKYQEKSPQMQNRRELTFLLQEAAFAEKMALYHVIDLECLGELKKEPFLKDLPKARSVIFLGIPIFEPLLLMEQTVYGSRGEKKTTMAESQVENDLRSFSDKLETMGYDTAISLPSILPNPEFAELLTLTKAGFKGKNQRFIIEHFGCRICASYLVSNAPLMGGDYRYPDYDVDQCSDCQICIDACPAGALTQSGYDQKCCFDYRDDANNQKRVAAHSIVKCNRCMAFCPIGIKTIWE